jgi:hypothetical protein
MSEFRLFCIVYFIATGALCSGVNHEIIPNPDDGAAGIVMLASMLACVPIAFFGKRRAA